MDRLYKTLLKHHLKTYRQMAFLVGPRQVGKTTVSMTAKEFNKNTIYLNWDYETHQRIIFAGPQAIIDEFAIQQAKKQKTVLILDEIHKFRNWRNYLKGFFDTYENFIQFIITGSARLDVFRTTGDSLMGRYFPYRIHPLSVAECIRTSLPQKEFSDPARPDKEKFEALLRYGGFPEPFTKQEDRFYTRWASLKSQQLFQEDIRDLTRIHEITQLKILSEFLTSQTGQLINYSNVAKHMRVSIDTVQAWINILRGVYYCFTLKPWSKNIKRSLLKQPKLYLWDWSSVKDEGAKKENFIACHLLKAIHLWTDMGFGTYDLFFVRDKEQQEVDFLITKNDKPWVLIEVKSSSKQGISSSLYSFQNQLKADHAFQIAFDLPYIEKDCFSYTTPVIVPALTFLSQLV